MSSLPPQRVCVFCGANAGVNPVFAAAAGELGALLARRGHRLVYGGGGVGLMGVLADAALDAGGEVIGVIPQALSALELAHPRVPDMRVVSGMHARKALMAELADGFVALPGGFGTLEELFEVVTWAQLGIHRKPIGLLNVAGYYDPLVAFLAEAAAQGFIQPEFRAMLVVEQRPEALLDGLAVHPPPRVLPVLGPRET